MPAKQHRLLQRSNLAKQFCVVTLWTAYNVYNCTGLLLHVFDDIEPVVSKLLLFYHAIVWVNPRHTQRNIQSFSLCNRTSAYGSSAKWWMTILYILCFHYHQSLAFIIIVLLHYINVNINLHINEISRTFCFASRQKYAEQWIRYVVRIANVLVHTIRYFFDITQFRIISKWKWTFLSSSEMKSFWQH